MMPDEDRVRLRGTFNEVAGSYDRVRPDYPREPFDDLIAIAGLGSRPARCAPPRLTGIRA